jgi:N-acetylglutamate synthase-like GNAT family acetyltransferase
MFAVVDGEVVGTAGLQKLDADTVELVKMAVSPEHQGRGLGGHLLQAMIKAARARGFGRLYIETNSALAASNHLYQKYGFRPTGQRASLHGYARADTFYELFLNPAPADS